MRINVKPAFMVLADAQRASVNPDLLSRIDRAQAKMAAARGMSLEAWREEQVRARIADGLPLNNLPPAR